MSEERAVHSSIALEVAAIAEELIKAGNLRPGQLLVAGVSTSEVLGQRIGTAGTLGAAEAIYAGLEQAAGKYGVQLAFQCCEHLNRALVVERETAERLLLEEVGVIPVPKAGGSMAAYAYQQMKQPCVVEAVRAHAGIDIGDTLIGMHLRPVAVPVRPTIPRVGAAHVTMAYSRPKLIGGPRAVYTAEAGETTPGCE